MVTLAYQSMTMDFLKGVLDGRNLEGGLSRQARLFLQYPIWANECAFLPEPQRLSENPVRTKGFAHQRMMAIPVTASIKVNWLHRASSLVLLALNQSSISCWE
jgi:hypothetical protein